MNSVKIFKCMFTSLSIHLKSNSTNHENLCLSADNTTMHRGLKCTQQILSHHTTGGKPPIEGKQLTEKKRAITWADYVTISGRLTEWNSLKI